MYLEHFGLQRQPFKITPDTSMFYTGNKRGAALDALIYAINSGEGIVKVVGEVGSGKTMICRMLEIELGKNIEIVYIANPSLSPDNILHVIAFELKLKITSSSGKLEVMQALQTYLLDKHATNNQVVVFVEEAQSMPVETLEEIRLLSNLETNESKLLQMVLFGQPELDDKLRLPVIRQLKERITHNFYLDPFPANDVYKYLNFRMRIVGYKGPDLFSEKIANNIEKKSNGLTRRINILADKALLAAYSDGRHDIKSKHINMAAKDSDFGNNFNLQIMSRVAILFLTVVSAVWIGTLLPEIYKHNTVQASNDEKESSVMVNAETNTGIVAMSGSTASQKTDSAGSVLSDHINKTQRWLKTAEDNSYTIQLILIDSWAKNELVNYITKSEQFLDNRNLYIYQASIRGRKVYSVLYNEYQSRDFAVIQLQKLSPWIMQSSPYLRTIKGIKADIRKTGQQLADKGGVYN